MPNSGCQHAGPDMSNPDFQYDGPDMHNPTTTAAIRERDLQLKGIGDETVKYGKWKRKVTLHNLAKNSYQSDKPEEDGDWWKLSGTRPNIPNAPTCSLPIIVVRLMAYIPICIPKNNTWTYPFKVIEEEGFLVKKQLAVWIKKWMKLTHAGDRNFSHLLIATPRTRYTASDFENYMPIQVKENYDQFIQEFIREHKGAHPSLNKDHISVFFSSLICGLDLFNQEQMAYHLKEVHGLEHGDLILDHPKTHTVETGAFSCPSLHGIEEMGETGQAMVSEVLFHRCRASGMFSYTGDSTNIVSHRAQELILGIKHASSIQFFQRFFMFLEQTLRSQGLQASKAFSCDWSVIQEALAAAIGDDQAVNRMILVSGLGHKDFTGQPLESLFLEVERKVDEYMEFQDLVRHASEMNHQYLNKYTLYFKYNLIIDVTINLDESFNLIRTCVLKEISVIYFSPMKLLSIPEFTTGLISTLEKKNLATDFRKRIVKPKTLEKGATGKKKNQTAPANTQNSGEEAKKKQFDKEYRSKCSTSTTRDENRKQELIKKAKELANNQPMEIKGHTVVDNPSMRAVIQEYSEPICGACLSGNC